MHPGAIQKSSVYLNVTYTTQYWSDKVFHFNAQNLPNYSAAVRSKYIRIRCCDLILKINPYQRKEKSHPYVILR